jgi:hypothetical protein
LTRTHRILIGIVVAGAVVIAAIGFAGSYAAVRELALDKGFGWFANVFPIGVDAGIVVLLALDLLLTWMRIPFPLLRQTAWLLTAATIAFNGAAAWPDPLGVGMHAIIPVLFVVSVEAARHAIGRIADITADKHMESVRITRWILAPFPTFRLWRRMKLWELRSYEEVIRREQDRLVYRARLRARYGVAWRRRAPVEAIMPLRLAKYGIPLSETAEAGLEAAGIEVARPVRQLTTAATASPAPAQPEPAPGPEAAEAENGPAPDAPRPQPEPLTPQQQQQYAHAYDQQRAYEQRMHEQQQYFQPFQGAPHDSPWFAAQQQLQQQYFEQRQQLEQQQLQQQQDQALAQDQQARQGQPGRQGQYVPQGQQQPVPMVIPSGAPGGRTRPLGSVGVNGLNAANGLNGRTIPGPRTEESPQQQAQAQAHPWPQAAHPEPADPDPGLHPEPAPDPRPVSGLDLPEGVPVDEAYYAAYRKYVHENNEFPNARRFAGFLGSFYGGTAPEERDLVTSIRDMRYRFQSEADTERIP